MAKRAYSSATTAEHIADHLNNRDEQVMQGLVTAGALVALADGRVEAVEREELVNFIDRQMLVPTMPRSDIAEAFDRRVRQLEDRDSAKVIIENLRPLVGLSLASVVLRTAERVAAADRQIHPGELQALELVRLIMRSLPAKELPARPRTCQTLGRDSVDTRRVQEDPAERFFDLRIRWLYQRATIRYFALIWSSHLRKQVGFVIVATIVALVIWTKSNVEITTSVDDSHPNEKRTSNLQLEAKTEVDVFEQKEALLPMFSPYLPFRILDPVY